MVRLTTEMSAVMSKLSTDPAASASTPDDLAKMGKELEEFTYKMEAEGVKPEDLLKAILGEDVGSRLGEMAQDEHDRRDSLPGAGQSQNQGQIESDKKSNTKTDTKQKKKSKDSTNTKPSSATATSKSFEDTIRKTIERMEDSSAKATDATNKASSSKNSEEALLAEMLRALESEAGAGNASASGDGEDDDDNLSKMFLGMMEQLTNKDMLYEPMKELDTKYPSWLASHQSSLASAEYARFDRQRRIVKEIVDKFESTGYSDDDPACRAFVWDKMQAMQGEGAPPEDLVANPLPGMGLGGLGLGEDGGGGAEEPQCPTQ